MDISTLKSVYLLGIGGIGMSALARYFHSQGAFVSGYDRYSSNVTQNLEEEGIAIHYDENIELIPANVDLVIITPAIPKDNAERIYLQSTGIPMLKRSEVLGMLTKHHKTIAVAGTHGKTTTSTLIAHILNQSSVGCNAFLGGISKNYSTNLIINPNSEWIVTEADEYDRSFHHLFPTHAVITAIDADHLDIYGNYAEMLKAFIQFAHQVKPGGSIVVKKGLETLIGDLPGKTILTYDIVNEADYFAFDIKLSLGGNTYSIKTPEGILSDVSLGVPALMNIENSVAAVAMAQLAGCSNSEIAEGLRTFKGILRRFEVQYQQSNLVYIDDYAHHPEEIKALVNSVRQLYPGLPITGIFQPHLYSRTSDFASGFAQSLDLLDKAYLLDIYPARERPIPGVDSHLIANQMINPAEIISKEAAIDLSKHFLHGILLTIGAGDIDNLVAPITAQLTKNLKA
jgi:UDP-N-acetylmuramate--alanine ligase